MRSIGPRIEALERKLISKEKKLYVVHSEEESRRVEAEHIAKYKNRRFLIIHVRKFAAQGRDPDQG